MLQKEVSLLEWCKLHSFPDIYAQLTRLEFSHPSDFCHLSEKDLNDLCHYLNLKFGRKAKFLSAVNSIKMTLQKVSPLNALPLTQEEYRKIEIILCAKERFIQCDDKLQSMIDQVENNNKLLKVEIQSQFEIFTNKLHTLLSQSLYEVEEKSADFLDMINHIRYKVNDTLKQFINYEISAKKAISIFELSQMAVRSATLNELFLKTSNLSVPNLIESLPSITVKFHPIFDIKDHEISHLLQISDLPSSILLPNDHLQTHLNQSFDYEKEIGEWTKSDEEDQREEREEREMIIHSIPSPPLTSSFQSYDIPHHFTPDYLTACQYLRSSNAQEKRKRREEREGGKRKERGRDQREDNAPSLPPSSSIPPRLVILLAGPSSVGKSTFISKFVIGNEGEKSDHSSSSLAPSSPPSSSSPQTPSTVPSSSSSVTLQTNVGDIIVEFREINTIKPKDEDQRKIIQSANGVVLLFDVTSRSSFKNIQSFYSSISRISGRIPMILCGNKIDRGNRVMMMMKKTSLYRLRNLSYYDLSLLFDFNIEKPLLYLLRKLTRCDHLSFLLSSFSSSSSFLSPLPANSPLSSPILPSPLSPPSPPPISSPLDPPPPLSSPSFSLSLSKSCSSIPPPSIDHSDDPLKGEFLLSDHSFDVHNQSDDGDDDVIETIHEYSQSHHEEEEIINDDDDDDDVVYDSNKGGKGKDVMNKLEKKKQKKKQQKKESKEEKKEEREDEKKEEKMEEVNDSIDSFDSTASIDFIDSTASIASIDFIDSTASLPPSPSVPSIPLPSSLGSSLSPSCSLTSSCDIFIPTQPSAPSLLSQSTPSLSSSFSSSSLSRSSFSNLSSSSAIDHKITIWEFRILSDQIRGPFVIGFARKPHPNYDDRDYDHYHDEIDQYQLQYWGLSNNGYLIDSDHILLSQKICDDLQMNDQVSVVFNDRLKEVKWVVNGVELEIKLQVNDCAENYFGFVGRSRGDLNLDHLNALDDNDSDFVDRYHDNDIADDENDDCDAVKLIHCSSY